MTAVVTGFQMLTVDNTAGGVALTVPTTGAPRYALIQCETNPVRWTDDGTAPTTTIGNLLSVGGVLKYDGNLSAIRFIRTGGSSGTLSVSYYSN